MSAKDKWREDGGKKGSSEILKAGLNSYQYCPAWNKPEACSQRPDMVSNRKDITQIYKDADTHAYTHTPYESLTITHHDFLSFSYLSIKTSIAFREQVV